MGRLTNPSGRTLIGTPVGPRQDINPVAFGKNIRVDDTVTPRPADNGDSLDDFIQELLNRPSATPIAILQELFDRTREISFNAARSWGNVGAGETGANYGRILLVDRGGGPTTYGSRAYVDMQPVVQTVGAGGLFNAGMLWVIPNAADRTRLRASILNADGSLHQVIGADHMREVPNSISVTGAPAATTTLWTATSDTHPSPMGNLAEGATGRIQLSAHTPVWDGLLKDFPQAALTAADALKLLRVKADHSGYELVTAAMLLAAFLPALASGDAGKLLEANQAEDGYTLVTKLASFLGLLGTLTAENQGSGLLGLNSAADGLEVVPRSDITSQGQGGTVTEQWVEWTGTNRQTPTATLSEAATRLGLRVDNHIALVVPHQNPSATYGILVVAENSNAHGTHRTSRMIEWGGEGNHNLRIRQAAELSTQDREIQVQVTNVTGQDHLQINPFHRPDGHPGYPFTKLTIYGLRSIGGPAARGLLQEQIQGMLQDVGFQGSGMWNALATGDTAVTAWRRILNPAELAKIDSLLTDRAAIPDHYWGTNDEGEWSVRSRSELGGYTLQEWATIAVPANYHTDGDAITNASWVQTEDGVASQSLIAAEAAESYAIYLRNRPALEGVFHLVFRLVVGGVEVDRVMLPWGGIQGRDDQPLSLSYQDSQFSYLYHLRPSKLANEFHNWRISLLGGNTGAAANTVIHMDAVVNYAGAAAQDQIDARVRAAGIITSPEVRTIRVLSREQFEEHDVTPRTLYFFQG